MYELNCAQCGKSITTKNDLIVSKKHFFSIPEAYHQECYCLQMEDIKSYYTRVEPINSFLYSLRVFMLTAVYAFLFSVRIKSLTYFIFLVVSGTILGVEWFSRLYSFIKYECHIPMKNQMRV